MSNKNQQDFTVAKVNIPGQYECRIDYEKGNYKVIYGGLTTMAASLMYAMKCHNDNVNHAMICAGELDD